MPPRPALVLAAGLGTRLRPLTDALPKPLVPIGDESAFAAIVATLRGADEGPVVANAWHAAEKLIVAAAPLGVAVSREGSLLGTAGGLRAAAPLLGPGDVLVWNGDILAAVDPRALRARHVETGAAATLAIAPRAAGEGTVGLGADGAVVRLRDVRRGEEVSGGDFLGIHVVGAPLLRGLPAVGCLVGDVYLPALAAGVPLATYATPGPFFDVGTPEAYVAANLAWLRGRGARVYLGPGAFVAGGAEDAVVGAGARVEGRVRNAVVWPGTIVAGDVTDGVATPHGFIATGRATGPRPR